VMRMPWNSYYLRRTQAVTSFFAAVCSSETAGFSF
jgi:hypothetical protein